MYAVLPSYALGFHGCDVVLAERVFAGKAHLNRSKNDFDWLGEGIYFWENSPARAFQYATELKENPRRKGPRVKTPAVVGAVIELGYCLNLLDAEFLDLLRESHDDLKALHDTIEVPLPKNKRIGDDLPLRRLDCAVINFMHQTRQERGLAPFDTVRAAFAEGGALFPDSGITAKHHIQLCVRRRSCIKGYFRPMSEAKLPLD
ncbi:MAG: hypothetical protein WBD40_16645 [Tepidisphaeraceae bacterium]